MNFFGYNKQSSTTTTNQEYNNMIIEESNHNNNDELLELIEQNAVTLDTNHNECMCMFSSRILKQNTEMWSFNRTLNQDKVKEIEKTLSKKMILDSILYLVYNKNQNKFIVFDGNHRRQAIINIYNNTGLNMNVFCYVYTINEEYYDKFDEYIYDKFKLINNNTPIPEIYHQILEKKIINKNENETTVLSNKVTIVENLLEQYKKQYKKFYSLSSNCYKPNFNDSKFYTLCSDLDFNTKEGLISLLNAININKKIELNNKTSLSVKNVDKCVKYGFYLFT